MASFPPADGGADPPTDDDPVGSPLTPPSRPLPSRGAALPRVTRKPRAFAPAAHQNPSSRARSSPISPASCLGRSQSFSICLDDGDLTSLFVPLPRALTAIMRSASQGMVYCICFHGEIPEFKSSTSWRAVMQNLLKTFISAILFEATGSSSLHLSRSFSHEPFFSVTVASRGYVCVQQFQGLKTLVAVTSEIKSRMSWSHALWELVQPLIYSDAALGTGYVGVSREHLIYVDGRYCFVWMIPTGETMVIFSVHWLFIPFPPINSSIVHASLTALVGMLTFYGNGLWCAHTWIGEPPDWAGLPEGLLQCIFPLIFCFRSLTAASHCCRSWRSVVSTLPRPFLLHPNLAPRTKKIWHIVAPTRVVRKGELQEYRIVTTPVLHTQYKLIGGSDGQLIFFNNSECYIQNIHTGSTITLSVPTCCTDIYYGVMSAQAESAEQYIILVGDSVLLRKNGAEGWVMRSLRRSNIGRIVDIVVTECSAFMMDAGKMLYTLSANLDVDLVPVSGPPRVPNHRARFGVPFGNFLRKQKAVIERNWLLESHGRIICIRYVQTKDWMAGFFAFCLDDDPAMDDFYESNVAHRLGLSRKQGCNTWKEIDGLGDCCVFLNMVSGVASFISDTPPRWGLTAGKIYMGDRDTLPWKSFSYGWVQYTTDDTMPLNAEWPSPLFLNSGYSLPRDEAGATNVADLWSEEKVSLRSEC
ncbi:hypothetical protein PVAP13_5NG243400 [Panicum virgatum]|uniref:KIB1-4 beta-propeller domain-containing protein n=1 Tax=Panicum virgatum TaxID=38727 RepID=A0A8T0RYC1_PANVG|nr:hypothetical protein PVAP13_5NG243400 [Panicum virgatum]